MSIEQVSLDIMNVNFTINTPSEEKDTLLQAVDMLNKKSAAIKESGRIVGSDKIAIMTALNVVHDLLKITLKDDLAIGDRHEQRLPKSFGAVGTKLIFLFPCGVREGIYSFEPISSLKVAGSCSGRERLSLDAPETARGDRLVNKVQADSAKTALAGIPIPSHARLRHGFHLSSASTSSEKPNVKSKNTSRYFGTSAMFSNLKTTFPNA